MQRGSIIEMVPCKMASGRKRVMRYEWIWIFNYFRQIKIVES